MVLRTRKRTGTSRVVAGASGLDKKLVSSPINPTEVRKESVLPMNEDKTDPNFQAKYTKVESFTDTLLRLVVDSPYSAAFVLAFMAALVLFGVWVAK